MQPLVRLRYLISNIQKGGRTLFKQTKAAPSFSVNDTKKAKDFYGKTLGLDVEEGKEGLELHIAGGTDVFVYPKPDHTPATFTILNFMVDNVEKTVDELGKRGVQFEKYDNSDIKTDARGIHNGPGPKIAWFKDPAGNILSVLEPTSMSKAS